MLGIAAFAHEVRHSPAEHLAPAEVSFRGSFAHGGHDQSSDVDLDAGVPVPLDGPYRPRTCRMALRRGRLRQRRRGRPRLPPS